ncbi:hypothetical protein [Pseudoalteromonas sp. BDTF-M6]|uniref:hypothetical protein n=1 Tax=Pseudoalteromonas sp. BDTF-M6 TaxID=2796132 RepID=UPI001BAEE2A6|nr:hypothetical protein [Pseudoalteromonas sp. BDTF-M6]MBS3797192.1 hypothetical protein [Pseudoalteromonas sp. BDTF-M6]
MAQEQNLELQTSKSTNIVLKSTFNLLKKAHNLYAEHRVKQFLDAIDSEVEYLSLDKQIELNEFLNSKVAQKVLADYASAITSTSSEIGLRALALTFINDRQFNFSENEKVRFISCINGIDDLKVNLFIKLASLKQLEFKTVYPVYVVNNLNFDALSLGVDVDELFAYTEDFIKRGLLLRDPRSTDGGNFYSPKDGDWSICFGISPTLQRFASVLIKAKLLAVK